MLVTVNIPVGDIHTEQIGYYNPDPPLSYGAHTLQAKIYNYAAHIWVPVAEPQTIEILNPSGISDMYQAPVQLAAYPNPFKSSLSLTIKARVSGETEIRIYNLKGKLVNTISAYTKQGNTTLSWNGKDAHGDDTPAGLYLVRVCAGKSSITFKCLKIE